MAPVGAHRAADAGMVVLSAPLLPAGCGLLGRTTIRRDVDAADRYRRRRGAAVLPAAVVSAAPIAAAAAPVIVVAAQTAAEHAA